MKKIKYSVDLKERVIESIKLDNDQNTSAKIFMVSKSSVSKWWIRYQKERGFKPKGRLGSKWKIDPNQLKMYVDNNEDKTLA